MSHRRKAVAWSAGLGVAILLVTAFVLPHYCSSSPGTAVALADTPAAAIHQHIGSTLLSDYAMQDYFGTSLAGLLAWLSPFLTPIGGLLLVFAHVYNIRLLSCQDRGCRCS
ncbi:MAG: hypothetical protein Aurels2KO_51490 [Aureliella sp.]